MYSEEGWINARIHDNKIISDDGLESASISKQEIKEMADSLGANIRFHDFHEFSVMAEITKR